MPIDRDMPLKEQMKFDIRAQEVELDDGDPQLDADGGATIASAGAVAGGTADSPTLWNTL